MTQITAQEAVQLSKLGKAPIKKNKPSKKLIEEINKRIQSACAYGKFFTMLNSLNYNGNGVRGIGVYLSNGEIASIEHYYKEFGFTIGRQYDPQNPTDLFRVWIAWGPPFQQINDEILKDKNVQKEHRSKTAKEIDYKGKRKR